MAHTVYQEAWEAAVGEELDCERELNNAHDHYAVAVKRMEVVVGHLPCKLSRLCLLVHVLEIYRNGLGDYFTPFLHLWCLPCVPSKNFIFR